MSSIFCSVNPWWLVVSPDKWPMESVFKALGYYAIDMYIVCPIHELQLHMRAIRYPDICCKWNARVSLCALWEPENGLKVQTCWRWNLVTRPGEFDFKHRCSNNINPQIKIYKEGGLILVVLVAYFQSCILISIKLLTSKWINHFISHSTGHVTIYPCLA